MFHILIENSTPNRLVGGPWEGLNNSRSDAPASTVECGLKGGTIREAITTQEFRTLNNNGNLNTERCCKVCLRKAGGKYSGKRKNTEVAQRENTSEQQG
jgi:hypothetical protein